MNRVLIVLSLLAFVGCGAEEGTVSEPESAATSTATASADPAAASAADTGFARKATLEEQDFPAGFTGSVDALASTCSAIEDIKSITTAPPEAATFQDEEGHATINSVLAFPDEDTAFRSFSALRGIGTYNCLAEELAHAVTTDPDFEWTDRDSKALPTPSVGDDVDAGRILAPVTVDGTEAEYTIDVVVVRDGRAVSLLAFVAVDEPFPKRLRDRITTASAEKLAANIS